LAQFDDQDLDRAVSTGALSAEQVSSFRSWMATRRVGPVADEEHFQLVSSFNDIFVVIACAIVLISIYLFTRNMGFVPLLLVAVMAWFMAEFFTRKRHMALPSITLLLTFLLSIFIATGRLVDGSLSGLSNAAAGSAGSSKFIEYAVPCLVTVVAAYLHWLRFRVPVTVAAGTCALSGAVLIGIIALLPAQLKSASAFIALLIGLAIFAFAMFWDRKDPKRVTRDSDIAFWLHLLAAPIIVQSIFSLIASPSSNQVNWLHGVLALVAYAIFTVVSLAVDRRALMVSALSFILFLLTQLIAKQSEGESSFATGFAIVGMLIGSGLLVLSAFWHRARKPIVNALPNSIAAKLPAIQ
jgi:hypothetical protein